MSLTGIFEKQIDSKGRVSIPKRMRERLGEGSEAIVTVLKIDSCLQIYPADEWDELVRHMERLSPFDERTRSLHRFWGMSTEEMKIDTEGRVSLSRDAKRYAGIESDVMIVGAINRIEIWSRDRWQSVLEKAPKLEDMANSLSPKSE